MDNVDGLFGLLGDLRGQPPPTPPLLWFYLDI